MIHELRDFARRVVAKATELDEVGVLDDWLQVFIELAKEDDEGAAQEQAGHRCDHRCGDDGHHAWPSPPVARAEQAQPGTAGWEPSTDQGDGQREATADRRSSPSSAPAATLGKIRTAELRADDPYVPPAAAGGVYVYPPTLGDATVEECARAGRQGFYVDTGDGDRTCSAWESISPGAREEWRACARAALTHYESRVVGPLREELAKLRSYTQRAQELTLHHGDKRMELMEENDKLRAELAALKAQPAPEVDGERRRLAKAVREGHYVWDDRERIATLLEQPAPRKSLGRKWVTVVDNELRGVYWSKSEALFHWPTRGTVTECDLVPVEEGE